MISVTRDVSIRFFQSPCRVCEKGGAGPAEGKVCVPQAQKWTQPLWRPVLLALAVLLPQPRPPVGTGLRAAGLAGLCLLFTPPSGGPARPGAIPVPVSCAGSILSSLSLVVGHGLPSRVMVPVVYGTAFFSNFPTSTELKLFLQFPFAPGTGFQNYTLL